MPEVHVYLAAGRTPEQKKKLMLEMTDAVVRSLGSPKELVTVQIIESPRDSKAKGGIIFSDM